MECCHILLLYYIHSLVLVSPLKAPKGQETLLSLGLLVMVVEMTVACLEEMAPELSSCGRLCQSESSV